MIPSLGDTLVVARTVIRAMETAEVDYYLGGSMASSIYGEPRFTRDLDFIVRMVERQIDSFVQSLGDDYYADAEMIREAIQLQSSANVIELRVAIKADIIVPKPSPFVDSAFDRKLRARVAHHPEAPEGFICSAEDILVQKLRWYRIGGEVSDQQWRDVKGVLLQQGKQLDIPYLERWASELGVSDLLERALNETARR